ncbi:hypothetical protein Ade02nite_35210 [Paractinoplanes deccanensis]|uniref:SPW repeat-containing protein n=1 Tax=Paractinoplanes deccanensis TaxID=113561 RepID=A0ABQ3Y4T9_9ACTN|nr:hypothetical protein [Actinoplanes deccanensis]GID74880.1 hypothetical protein Ade02nite_35210 [Actinoplanes deccanensis]
MSAWQIGSRPPTPKPPERRTREQTAGSRQGTQQFVNTLTKWIPGDALAVYVTGVTALHAQPQSRPSVPLLVVVAVVAPLLVIGGAWATGKPLGTPTWVSAGLALVAFGIWSLTVPFSGWQRWSLISGNQEGVAIGAAVAALLFGLFAEGLVLRVTPAAKRATAEGA